MKNLLILLISLISISSCSDIEYSNSPKNEYIEKSSESKFKILTNINCINPCKIYVNHDLNNISYVEYYADNWKLGVSIEKEEGFKLYYNFNKLGRRLISAIAFNANGENIEIHKKWIQIYEENLNNSNNEIVNQGNFLDIPYFYQYDNLYYPGSTCQNTSIAMVLKNYGWLGIPDNITSTYGKNYTQSPAGLADVFNTISDQKGLSKKIVPITNGTLSGLKQELDKGHPVIIHGYFTSSGHVVVVVGYDNNGYWVNDPAGVWVQTFMGGYGYNSAGKATYYKKQPFEAAVATDGYNYLPLWYHVIREK